MQTTQKGTRDVSNLATRVSNGVACSSAGRPYVAHREEPLMRGVTHLGGFPALLTIFIVAAVLVRAFVVVDHAADSLVAQLHQLRRTGGRSSRLLLCRRGASALPGRALSLARVSSGKNGLTK